MKKMTHIITCDLEDWYHPSLVKAPMDKWETYRSHIEENVNFILDLLDQTNSKATFFVLGYVAERFPSIIKKIDNLGHEIASHSYRHQLVYHMTPDEFYEDTKKAVSILKEITGKSPKGYRAPSWSTSIDLKWYWQILKENGFQYDSSLYPYKTFLYGDNSNPNTPYQIREYGLFEVPPSVGTFLGKKFPFSGGFFLRVLPMVLIRAFIGQYDRMQIPAVLYFHPWELDPKVPKMDLGLKNNFITYAKIRSFQKKLIQLTQRYNFSSIEAYLENINHETYRS